MALELLEQMQMGMCNMFKSKKGVSALIATILLVVVAVALVSILLTWGKSFTSESISKVDTFKDGGGIYFIQPVQFTNGTLIFKNISTNNKSLTITGYKIISSYNHQLLNSVWDLPEPVTIAQGDSAAINIPYPPERKFDMLLYSSDGYYVDLKNITYLTVPNPFSGIYSDVNGKIRNYDTIKQTSDGGYIAVGQIYKASNEDQNVYATKTKADGTQDWNKIFDFRICLNQSHCSGDLTNDVAHSVDITSDGKYIIAIRGPSSNTILFKISSIGIQDWNKTIPSTTSIHSNIIKATNDNGFILATTNFGEVNGAAKLIKLDSNGNVLWTWGFGSGGGVYFYSVEQTIDGGYIATALLDASSNAIIKITASGTLDWNKIDSNLIYSGPIKQTSDGGYAIISTLNNEAVQNMFVLTKTDSLGNTIWTGEFEKGGYYEIPSGFDKTFDGGYIIVGQESSWDPDTWELISNSIVLVKMNSTGGVDWNKTYSSSNVSNVYGYSVEQTADGSFIVNGYDDVTGIRIIKTDANGNV